MYLKFSLSEQSKRTSIKRKSNKPPPPLVIFSKLNICPRMRFGQILALAEVFRSVSPSKVEICRKLQYQVLSIFKQMKRSQGQDYKEKKIPPIVLPLP